MADVRINAAATASTLLAPDDFIESDGTVNGTRKLAAGSLHALRNALANAPGIYADGTSAPLSLPASSAWAPGTDELSLYLKLALDDYTPTATKVLIDWVAANLGGRLSLLTTGYLRLQIGNGSNLTTYSYDSTAKLSDMVPDGFPCHVAAVCSRAGNVTFKVNGVTLGAAVSIAAASAQTLTSTSALRIFSDGTNRTAGYIFGGFAPLYNLALSDADCIDLFLRGGAVLEKYKFGTQANRFPTGNYLSFGAADANVAPAGNNGGATWTSTAGARTGGAGAYYHKISGSGWISWVPWSLGLTSAASPGSQTFLVRFWARLNVGTSGGGLSIGLGPHGGSNIVTGGTGRQAIGASWTQYAYILNAPTAKTATLGMIFFDVQFGSPWEIDIDDMEVIPLGASLALPLDAGLGYQIEEQANRVHGLTPATGVFHLLPSDGPVPIRYVTDGTTTAQKLCGGTTIPALSKILYVLARSQSGTPNYILGTASGGSQVVASVALSTTWKDCTLALTGGIVTSAADLWTTVSAANAVEILVFWVPLKV